MLSRKALQTGERSDEVAVLDVERLLQKHLCTWEQAGSLAVRGNLRTAMLWRAAGWPCSQVWAAASCLALGHCDMMILWMSWALPQAENTETFRLVKCSLSSLYCSTPIPLHLKALMINFGNVDKQKITHSQRRAGHFSNHVVLHATLLPTTLCSVMQSGRVPRTPSLAHIQGCAFGATSSLFLPALGQVGAGGRRWVPTDGTWEGRQSR